MTLKETVTTGRRKTSVASVRLRDGSGNINVNGRPFEEYFTQDIQRKSILAPFNKIGGHKRHDIIIRVKGGGLEGQTIAVRLGLARALVEQNEGLRHDMKEQGFLTRDPRKRERKKYGHAGARKRFQFSKR